jgi:hypothetical protein
MKCTKAQELYLNKEATGVGFKKEKDFHIWPVAHKNELKVIPP